MLFGVDLSVCAELWWKMSIALPLNTIIILCHTQMPQPPTHAPFESTGDVKRFKHAVTYGHCASYPFFMFDSYELLMFALPHAQVINHVVFF